MIAAGLYGGPVDFIGRRRTPDSFILSGASTLNGRQYSGHLHVQMQKMEDL